MITPTKPVYDIHTIISLFQFVGYNWTELYSNESEKARFARRFWNMPGNVNSKFNQEIVIALGELLSE